VTGIGWASWEGMGEMSPFDGLAAGVNSAVGASSRHGICLVWSCWSPFQLVAIHQMPDPPATATNAAAYLAILPFDVGKLDDDPFVE
jgi:hypothetical protein